MVNNKIQEETETARPRGIWFDSRSIFLVSVRFQVKEVPAHLTIGLFAIVDHVINSTRKQFAFGKFC